MHIGNINIEDYNYPLPDSRIAMLPLAQRDQSKLLVYKDGKISEDVFASVKKYIPENSLVVLNNTKVIHARLLFRKETGSEIEIFCLEPVLPSADHQLAFAANSGVVWKCLVGNNKKWKEGTLSLKHDDFTLFAERIVREADTFLIRFTWSPAEIPFAEVVEECGKIPLPPYIKRDSDDNDAVRYQTVYARNDGSVAAPTAGLHFTDEVMASLAERKITTAFVTLHVGAGTFKPVSAKNIADHAMHREFFTLGKNIVQQLIGNENNITAVGTTTVRTLESLYWAGRNLTEGKKNPFEIGQWTPYESSGKEISLSDSLSELLKFCDQENIDQVMGSTSLMIVPGYKYRVVNTMITNFHQPKSTLLLLVSAFIGEQWKESYTYALENNFRFLSYGDACIFKPQPKLKL